MIKPNNKIKIHPDIEKNIKDIDELLFQGCSLREAINKLKNKKEK